MGSFSSGRWIVGLFIYFFLFFTVTYSVINEVDDTDISFKDPGFGSQVQNESTSDEIDFSGNSSGIDYSQTESTYSGWKATIAVITGINSANVQLGVPSEWQFVFSFFLFWLPFLMLIWSIYMAIPFFH